MDPSASNGTPSLVHSTEGVGKPLTPQDIDRLFPLIVRTALPTTASIDLSLRTCTSSIPVRMISGGVGTEEKQKKTKIAQDVSPAGCKIILAYLQQLHLKILKLFLRYFPRCMYSLRYQKFPLQV